MLDSGAGRSACPRSHAPDVEVQQPSADMALATAWGKGRKRDGKKSVDYIAGDVDMIIDNEVTDVVEPIAAMSVVEDAGCSWIVDGVIEQKPEAFNYLKILWLHNTYWPDLNRQPCIAAMKRGKDVRSTPQLGQQHHE